MDNISFFIIYCFFLFIMSLNMNKFIMSLISIEMLMISTVCVFLMSMIKMEQEYYVIFFLIIMVTESVMGLALLVMMSRIFNNDSTKIMNSQW